jgi:hypothetical protein
MAKMWRWAVGLQVVVELLHGRSTLAWHIPTAGVVFLAAAVWRPAGVVWALEGVALAPTSVLRAGQALADADWACQAWPSTAWEVMVLVIPLRS